MPITTKTEEGSSSILRLPDGLKPPGLLDISSSGVGDNHEDEDYLDIIYNGDDDYDAVDATGSKDATNDDATDAASAPRPSLFNWQRIVSDSSFSSPRLGPVSQGTRMRPRIRLRGRHVSDVLQSLK